jgi:two-component sensor histidine kinase
MQARTVDDPAIREVLREAQNRVKSIALVHEKLYQSKSLDRIDYRDYLRKISRHLYESYGVSPRTIAMNIHADSVSLHIDKAVPCSLIINELLSNAFKHAFEKNGTSMIIRYRDNGIGLPENLSIAQSETLGMRLLDGLTRQLHGTIEVGRADGTSFSITFPLDTASGDAA